MYLNSLNKNLNADLYGLASPVRLEGFDGTQFPPTFDMLFHSDTFEDAQTRAPDLYPLGLTLFLPQAYRPIPLEAEELTTTDASGLTELRVRRFRLKGGNLDRVEASDADVPECFVDSKDVNPWIPDDLGLPNPWQQAPVTLGQPFFQGCSTKGVVEGGIPEEHRAAIAGATAVAPPVTTSGTKVITVTNNDGNSTYFDVEPTTGTVMAFRMRLTYYAQIKATAWKHLYKHLGKLHFMDPDEQKVGFWVPILALEIAFDIDPENALALEEVLSGMVAKSTRIQALGLFSAVACCSVGVFLLLLARRKPKHGPQVLPHTKYLNNVRERKEELLGDSYDLLRRSEAKLELARKALRDKERSLREQAMSYIRRASLANPDTPLEKLNLDRFGGLHMLSAVDASGAANSTLTGTPLPQSGGSVFAAQGGVRSGVPADPDAANSGEGGRGDGGSVVGTGSEASSSSESSSDSSDDSSSDDESGGNGCIIGGIGTSG